MISIIVPIYNAERFLHRCVKSVIDQTYKDIEIILVDDGSTDGSSKICDEYASKYLNIKTIHKENGGLQAARISGIEVASGEYLGFVDADDWIESQMYEHLINSIGDCDLATSGYIKNGADGTVIFEEKDILEPGIYEVFSPVFVNNWFFSDSYDGTQLTSGGLTNSLCLKLFRTDLARESFPKANLRISCCEDYLSLTHYLLKCKKVAVTDKKYYHYCENNESMTRRAGNRIVIDQGILYNSIVEALKGNPYEEELLRQFRKRFVYELQPMIVNQLGMDGTLMFPRYRYPNYRQLINKRIVLFGAGRVGRDYYADWVNNDLVDVVMWVDSNSARSELFGEKICSPQSLDDVEYDLIVCAVLNMNTFLHMKNQLIEMGISEEKIIWKKPIDYLLEYYKRL